MKTYEDKWRARMVTRSASNRKGEPAVIADLERWIGDMLSDLHEMERRLRELEARPSSR